MNCPVCNKKNNEGASFCSNCGEPLKTSEKKCDKCGATNLSEAAFCQRCGKPLNDGAERKPSKSLNLAKLLVILSVAFIVSMAYHLYGKYHYRVKDYSYEMVGIDLKKTGEMEYVLGYEDPMGFYYSGSSGNDKKEVENKALAKYEEKMNKGVHISGVLCFLALVGYYYLRRRENAALKET